jgi:NADH-quinone oxidoreductase subunit F
MNTDVKTIILEEAAAAYRKSAAAVKRRIIVCAGTGCVANGSLKVIERLKTEIAAAGLNVTVDIEKETGKEAGSLNHISKSGCQGFCQMGPLVRIEPDGVLYVKVTAADAPEIVAKTLAEGALVERLLFRDPRSGKVCKGDGEIPFYARQKRLVLENCCVEPDSVGEYIAGGGYFGARKALTAMSQTDICAVVAESGLRGRGGGGFPTGRKWQAALASPGPQKYIVCNGDEGDPGAFMDRSVMEGNPHSIIEGMMIAARAIGADAGYVYVRAEYPLAVKRIRKAIGDAGKAGLLGENIFGSGLNFKLEVMEGAGAFVCGEETALLASIEGRRGMPMPKPPFPAQKGLWGKPTVINNVETLATIPYIIRNGAAAYRKIGTAGSPGTKTFALTGHVANTGLIEVPFGVTLREIVYNIGGGVADESGAAADEDFKSVQIGGPSGGCLTPGMLDMPLDFDSLRDAGAMVGSGGLVVMNRKTCMVSVARFFMQFTQNESCGKCVPCREGTKQMLALLDDIIEGRADGTTIPLLEETARAVRLGSLCGLGKTAPNPVLSTLRFFRAEYEEHVKNKYCPAGQCKALAKPEIIAEKCKGCGLCKKKCPVQAINGEKAKPHTIDITKCVKCGVCRTLCKFAAVTGV